MQCDEQQLRFCNQGCGFATKAVNRQPALQLLPYRCVGISHMYKRPGPVRQRQYSGRQGWE
jgi:hypothetical protein